MIPGVRVAALLVEFGALLVIFLVEVRTLLVEIICLVEVGTLLVEIICLVEVGTLLVGIICVVDSVPGTLLVEIICLVEAGALLVETAFLVEEGALLIKLLLPEALPAFGLTMMDVFVGTRGRIAIVFCGRSRIVAFSIHTVAITPSRS